MSAAPSRYDRVTSFFSYEVSYPSAPKPGATLDAEFNAVAASLNATISRLGEIQRDDGKLANGAVHPDSLSDAIYLLLGSGFNPRGAWVTATIYTQKDFVSQGGIAYVAVVTHVSGTFATDLAAGKWQAISSTQSAAQVPFVPAGGIASTTVQDALEELDADMGGYQPANDNLSQLAGLTGVADRVPYFSGAGVMSLATFTSAGRTLVAAADAAAQRVALGVDAGTTANKYVQLTAAAKLPAVDASLLTNVTVADGAIDAAKLATVLNLSGKTLTLPAANTPVFTKSFTSAEQTITSGGLLTLAHGMSVAPKLCALKLVCKTADLGYAVNDVVDIATTAGVDVNGSTRGVIVRTDATNVYVRFGTNVTPLTLLTASGGASASITIANWRLVVSAYA